MNNPEGDLEIFTMNPDGSGLKQLTFNTANDSEPVLSAGGKKIAFVGNRDGNEEVYKMTAKGSSQTHFTNDPATDSRPNW